MPHLQASPAEQQVQIHYFSVATVASILLAAPAIVPDHTTEGLYVIPLCRRFDNTWSPLREGHGGSHILQLHHSLAQESMVGEEIRPGVVLADYVHKGYASRLP